MNAHPPDGPANPKTPALAHPSPISAPRVPQPVARAGLGSANAPVLSTIPTALDLLRCLLHRWMLAIPLGLLLGAGATWVAWKSLPTPNYSAQAMIRVMASPPKIIFNTAEVLPDTRSYQATLLALLKSTLVLDKALSDEGVKKLNFQLAHPDPIRYLEEKIEARFIGEILRISMQSRKPEEPAMIVNAIVDAFFSEVIDKDEVERKRRFTTLETLYKDYRKSLDTKRQELKNLADSLGSFDEETATYQLQLSHQRQAAARQELLGIEAELRKIDAQLAVIEKSSQHTPVLEIPASEIDAILAQDSRMLQYDAQIADLHSRLSAYRRVTSNITEPTVRRSADDLLRLKREQSDYAARLRHQIVQQLRAERVGASDQGLLQDQKRILEERRDLATREVDVFKDETKQTNNDVWMLQKIKDEIAHVDVAARKIGDEVEFLKVELDAPKRITRLESAKDPRTQPDDRMKKAGIVGAGVFGVVVLGISFLEFRSRRIRSADVLVQGLGMPLVGALPPLPQRRGALTGRKFSPRALQVSETQWQSVMLESVDAMRTLLLRLAAVESVRTVMVTSAVAGEGKTSLACHLATSLARAGRKTLLVDCDLRKPAIYRIYDIPASPGLSEVLRGEIAVDEAIQGSGTDGLSILTAGRPSPKAIQSLALPDTHHLFDHLKEQYDFVIVDTAPILPVADTLLLGEYVDGVIYSVLRDVSRVPKVQAASERLQSVGIRILGAVMTGVHNDTYGSTYYQYASTADA